MRLEDQVVSLELAKRLKELGVKQESVWVWWFATDRDDTPALNRHPDQDCHTCGHPPASYFDWVSAFTVAELGEMLPSNATEHYPSVDTDDKGSKTEWFTVWFQEGGDIGHKTKAGTEADARAKMLIYLLENKLITA